MFGSYTPTFLATKPLPARLIDTKGQNITNKLFDKNDIQSKKNFKLHYKHVLESFNKSFFIKMNWENIKNKIRNDLLLRNLKTPSRRLNELENLERLMTLNLNDFIKDPVEMFGTTEKESFKKLVAKYKSNGKLNGAEISLINHIYKIIDKNSSR